MALSLGDVDKKTIAKKKKKAAKKTTGKKKVSAKPATKKKVAAKKNTSKTRPWQSPGLDFEETIAPKDAPVASVSEAIKDASEQISGFDEVFGPNPSVSREQRRKQLQDELIREWLAVAQEYKQIGLSRLPDPLADMVKDSWLGKIELSPRVKIPVPEFFYHKTGK